MDRCIEVSSQEFDAVSIRLRQQQENLVLLKAWTAKSLFLPSMNDFTQETMDFSMVC